MAVFRPTTTLGTSPLPPTTESTALPVGQTLQFLNAGEVATDSTKFVVHPASPAAYAGLRTGPEFTIVQEQNEAPQVEGSDAMLRMLSPFVIQVELPLVFGENGGFSEVNQINVDTYGIAARGSKGYDNARSALARFGLGMTSGLAVPTDPVLAEGRADGKLGEPAIADFQTAVDIARQLKAALKAPPLALLINPEEMTINYDKLQQFTDRTRFGYIFNSHGEDQPKLRITARCGAFYSGGRGVSHMSRLDSVAWQNLANVFTFYKNNGYIYDTLGKSNAHHFVGCLSIRFDQWVYYGSMESFSWVFDENNQQGGITFDMEFTVSSMLDTAQAPTSVAPMRSPTANPGDPSYAGFGYRPVNQENVVNVSVGAGGFSVQLGDGRSFPSGFREASPAPSQREVLQANPQAVSPFGRR